MVKWVGGANEMRRFLYVFAPVFLLALFLGSFNLATRRPATVVERTPTNTPTREGIAQLDVNIPATAEPLSITPTRPSPTQTPSPTLPPTFVVQLLGPPPSSTFEKDDPVSFYWNWPQPLTKNQQFVLYLVAEHQEIRLETMDEPNVGKNYHLGIVLENLEPGNYYWQTRLEQINPPAILAESELRPLIIVARPQSQTN